MWPAGTCVLPTSTTRAAMRLPSRSVVHTSIPIARSTTRTAPPGVAMRVLAARQIGHGGGPDGVRDVTVTNPSERTVPLTSWIVDWSFERARNSKAWSLPVCVRTMAFSSL